MNQSLGLQQTLKQQLTLSPQLIQTFEILAMPTLELQQKIRMEIEQNPALQIPTLGELSLEDLAERENQSVLENDFSDISAYDPSQSGTAVHLSSTYDQEAADRNQQYLEGALSHTQTLQEYLLWQLGCLRLDRDQMEIGRLIISNLDNNGFHRNPLESLVEKDQQELLYAVLPIIQSLDPPGIAVSDFRESLVNQAKADNLEEEDLRLFTELVYHHLEQMRLNKTKEVAKALDISEERLSMLYRYLKTLNPFPGIQYASDETQYVIPDLIVRNIDGKLQLRLHTDYLSTLSLDPEFLSLAEDHHNDVHKDAAAYIHAAVRSAKQLISQVQVRSQTMKKIGLELLKFQYEFFLHGPKYLKPLTYRMIAQDLSLHETTISRAVQGKYIDTDWGILPIKQLFSSAVQTTGPKEENLSKRAVMEIIQEIIASTSGEKPLSDQRIADMLESRGIKIARRTVSKYRKSLNIDSSYIRSK